MKGGELFLRTGADRSGRFLKVLEEPSEGTRFLLISQYLEGILPTVLNRCLQIELPALKNEILATIARQTIGESPLRPFSIWPWAVREIFNC